MYTIEVCYFYFEGNCFFQCTYIMYMCTYWFGPLLQSQFLRWPPGKINCPPLIYSNLKNYVGKVSEMYSWS